MKAYLIPLLLLCAFIFFSSCHTLNRSQAGTVQQFVTTAKETPDLPYNILYNYYTVKFKRKQLVPENYVTGDTGKEEMDKLAENVIGRIEEIRDEYYDDLNTANEIKAVYELLAIYINSLEKLSDIKYAGDFEKRSAEMGMKMNNLVSKLNTSPRTKTGLSLKPGEWLSSLLTTHGRIRVKTRQAELLKEYIDQADTLVQAVNRNYQEIQSPVMKSWFDEENGLIRDQFKRSIAPFLQNINRHPDSAASIVAIEFYSKINPVYYELTDEIYKNQLLIKQTANLMNDLASTHKSLKAMFINGTDWRSVSEEIDGLKDELFVLQSLLGKEGQDKFSFYKTFLMQNEKSLKDIIHKQ